jgi:intergrase/recombinase
MRQYKDHLIISGSKIKEALIILDKLAEDAIIFVIDENEKLIGFYSMDKKLIFLFASDFIVFFCSV